MARAGGPHQAGCWGELDPLVGLDFVFDDFVDGELVHGVDAGFEELTEPFRRK